MELDARSKHVRNALLVVLALIIASGGVFIYEYLSKSSGNGVAVEGTITEKHRKPHGGLPWGDPYEIVIEFQINGHSRQFTTSRAVWDTWGEMNRVGGHVRLLILADGRTYIDKFNYLYPVTTTLLVLSAIGLLATLWILVILESNYSVAAKRREQYRRARSAPARPLSANRRQLLRHMHNWFAMLAGIMVLFSVGITKHNLWWLALGGLVLVFPLALWPRKKFVCPHCGASMVNELRNMVPNITGRRTNWLTVRDYLAKGVGVTCQKCGRSLDDS